MAEIRNPTLETVTVTCDACGTESILRRVDDLREAMPIAGKRVLCPSCGELFWITHDRIGSAFQFILDDARQLFRAKRYVPAVTTLCEAWEAFFTLCARSTLVYRPVFASDYADAAEINALTAQLTAAIPKFTFFRLRHLVIDFLVVGTRPTEAVSAAKEISRITTRTKSGDFNCEPSAEFLDRAPTPRRREAAHALKNLKIGRLRNQVAHGRGGYLSREDVEPCFEDEIGVLYRVKHVLGVGDWMEHQANAVYEDE